MLFFLGEAVISATYAALTYAEGPSPDAGGYDPAGYGEAHADIYDRIYPAFPTDLAVKRITALASGRHGPILDLGIGTGRLALPLHKAGVDIHGIDASPAMIARLRSRPSGTQIPVWKADLTTFELPHRYSIIVCAVSTLFMLPDRHQQISCLRHAAQHLAPGGAVVIETFVPNPCRYDSQGHRLELRRVDGVDLHVVFSHHDSLLQSIAITHLLAGEHDLHRYSVTLHYAWPTELDLMATDAGLRLVERTGGWDSHPYTADSTDYVSVYEPISTSDG
jgi:2-polyprenyl-3-methyl-5-hydroxy-6-metoxy-1,4-benzoquinol methylase